MRRSPSVILMTFCFCVRLACADAPVNTDANTTIAQEIDRLFADLDSDEFSVRTAAFDRLQELSGQEEARPFLAESVERAMVDTEISFEVRKQLERLQRNLPPAKLAPSPKIDADSVDQLLTQLADDSYARRLGAENRLRWLLENPDTVDLIYVRVKHVAGETHLPREQTRSLKQIYDTARAAWLGNEARLKDPAATEDQIQHLLNRIASNDRTDRFRLTDEPAALVELRDLLACDANVAPIRSALEARLSTGDISDETTKRFGTLLELTKPAMVAEYWRSGRHENVQHLLVGVPSVVENQGTSHFDRIDDRTAHCVSGVNLSEGDYPVGVAFPHPRERNSFFHLVNLPTPRRRMAYEYRVTKDEAGRYAALVARTLDRYLDQKLPIDEQSLSMIMQFNPREVSRFAGRYLATVDDRRVVIQTTVGTTPPDNAVISRDGPSIHGLLCSWLASKGTQDAVPGLLDAIEKNRMLPPTETSPCRFDLFAALAIAQRDPWPNVDRWLADVIDRTTPVVVGQDENPELGASAATLLLRRHGGNQNDFDLIPCGDGYARRYGLLAYRYGTPDAPQKVADWWQKRQAEHDTEDPPVALRPLEKGPAASRSRPARAQSNIYQPLPDLPNGQHQEKNE